MPATPGDVEGATAEVVELHRFFELWFRAELEKTEADFRRFRGVLADDFEMIPPGGTLVEREPLLAGLWSAHGSREADFRIWTANHRHRQVDDRLAIVTYEEWQEENEQARGRLSTVLFRNVDNDWNGLAWLHVHETWID